MKPWWIEFLPKKYQAKYIAFLERKKDAISYQIDAKNAIVIKNVSFIKEKKRIVDNFSFEFKKNKVYGIVGPSGSGKSVLAEHFNGIAKSKQGNIYFFNGEKILFFQNKIKNYVAIRKDVGMVLQFPEYQLFKDTVLEDVCYGPKALGLDLPIDRAKAKLIELGLGEEFFDSNPLLLSGGQKRKAALAGILVIDPQIIVFDEPTIGLDPYSEGKIVEIIQKLRKEKKTIIVISNNTDLIFSFSDEVIALNDGKLEDWGDPYFIFRNNFLTIGKTKIIEMIEKLEKLDAKFKALWEYKPRNIKELSLAIAHVVSK